MTLLSPALDAPQGHPAIWQKLLSYSAQHIIHQEVSRLFSDLPDQPLLVNTFKQVGFALLTQVTIWRLFSDLPDQPLLVNTFKQAGHRVAGPARCGPGF